MHYTDIDTAVQFTAMPNAVHQRVCHIWRPLAAQFTAMRIAVQYTKELASPGGPWPRLFRM